MKQKRHPVEEVTATAVLLEDRYVGCYYPVAGQLLRVFNRTGETNLLGSVERVLAWLGAPQETAE
jgi:hypothetical protein